MAHTVAGVLRRVRVVGDSMRPTLAPGDRVLALRRWRRLRAGDIVLVRDPREPTRWIVKRCVAMDAGTVTLRGDNESASTDSRAFGPVRATDVRWLVLAGRARRRS